MNRHLGRLACRAAALAALVLGTAGCTSVRQPPTEGVPRLPQRPVADPTDSLRYDQWMDVACHNCYDPEKSKVKSFASVLGTSGSLEVDIYPVVGNGTDAVGGRTWFVRHDRKAATDNRNNCPARDGAGQANDLRACLEVIRDWVLREPRPRVVTVFLDLKQTQWMPGRGAADLDTLLLGVFGNRLFRPADLAPSASPGAGPAAREWPRLSEMNGRVMFVLTGGDDPGSTIVNANRLLRSYVRERGGKAVAFVAPSVLSPFDVAEPWGRDDAALRHVVFYNMVGRFANFFTENAAERKVGRAIRARGAIGRIWWTKDSAPPAHHACRAFRLGFQRPAVFAFQRAQPCSDVTR